MTGLHSTGADSTLEVGARFNDAINRHAAATVAAQFSDHTAFENTGTGPSGRQALLRQKVMPARAIQAGVTCVACRSPQETKCTLPRSARESCAWC